MSNKVRRVMFLFLMAALVWGAGFGAAFAEKVSRALQYSGYSEPVYTGIRKMSYYAPMSDGEKIAFDAYIPTGGPETSFPVIIEYTPYTRAFIDVKDGPLHKALRKSLLKSDSPVLDVLSVPGDMTDAVKTFIAHGYVFVRADIRGCGASTGWKADFMPRIGEDGGELVDYIATLDWCDGNVGMIGGSYSGYSQIVSAGCAGPALKAIMPVVVPLDGFHGQVYPGGIYQNEFMSKYSARLGRLNLNYYDMYLDKYFTKKGDKMLPAAPVVDEDKDGDLTDEIPLDLNRNGTFLDDYNWPDDPSDPPRYKDGAEREHIYYMATRAHQLNASYHFWARGLMYIDQLLPWPMGDKSAYDFSPSARVPAIMEKDIAVYNVGGWHDVFTRGTIEYYCTMKDSNPSRLMIHPGYHGGGGPHWEYLGEDDFEGFLPLLVPEAMRFFDFYLKGIENGFGKEAPVLIYVQNGGGWRVEKEWPLSRAVMRDYYFNSGHVLSTSLSTEGGDEYKADFTHDSRYGKALGNRYLSGMGLAPDAMPFRGEKDKQCLTYTTAPLSADLEVTGHPLVTFWASSTADYGDFYVYLTDVDETGQSVLVTEGLLRAGFAELVNNDEIIRGGGSGIDVLPDLPWHGFERSDYVDSIFKGGRVVELTLDLKPTSWVFRKGHSIRVAIACADWPTFRLHPRLAPYNDPESPTNIVPAVTVHRGGDRPSAIRLPVVPG